MKTPRRGRSSRNAEQLEKEQQKEAEKSEKMPGRRGRRPGAVAKEATDGGSAMFDEEDISNLKMMTLQKNPQF